jgi:hypothetical protein
VSRKKHTMSGKSGNNFFLRNAMSILIEPILTCADE